MGPLGRPAATLAALVVLLSTTAGVGACAPARASGPPVATASVDLPPSYRFAPASITVRAGTTVTWTNDDHFTHSVQFLDGGLPSSPLVMQPGQKTTFTFAQSGTYHYQCHIHPQDMRGSVTVTP